MASVKQRMEKATGEIRPFILAWPSGEVGSGDLSRGVRVWMGCRQKRKEDRAEVKSGLSSTEGFQGHMRCRKPKGDMLQKVLAFSNQSSLTQ